MLKASKQPPDNLEEYRSEFGSLGPVLQGAVVKARTATTTPIALSQPTIIHSGKSQPSVTRVVVYSKVVA